ncbi:MAG: VOC family protein [Candidatus Dormibacteria bacterium]
MGGVNVLFVAGFGPISSDVDVSRRLYEQALGIHFQVEEGDYLHTEGIDGAKTFAIWPLSQAAESCFGSSAWPPDMVTPQAWLEFDVDDIESAGRELEERGYRLLVRARTEPWGQVVSRLISPEGLLVGLTVTPALREKE